ncbi:MAG: hypothetical protein J1F28_02565 [Oscillospiraceae bacterium]|nr:hypothetical protein [Oscillospiraceae bacterium]
MKINKKNNNLAEPYAETIVPAHSALPQEIYTSQLALPFAVYTEVKVHIDGEDL